MKPIISEEIQRLLACPQCKLPLRYDAGYTCVACGRTFGQTPFGSWDFTMRYPEFLAPSDRRRWRAGQDAYEDWFKTLPADDDYEIQLRERNLVSEVYAGAFSLSGSVLDVGGHRGQLRHFLPEETTYLSVDTCPFVFANLPKLPNLLRAYPCLSRDCNFASAEAEYLPLVANAFDWVNMRSVLDHFLDPALAIFEAHRVLRPGGKLLVGVHVTGGKSPLREGSAVTAVASRLRRKLKYEGIGATLIASLRRLMGRAEKDHHIWHPSYDDLLGLLRFAKFSITKVHWQSPPYDHVVFVMGTKA